MASNDTAGQHCKVKIMETPENYCITLAYMKSLAYTVIVSLQYVCVQIFKGHLFHKFHTDTAVCLE